MSATCTRCGKYYLEAENIGRWRCRKHIQPLDQSTGRWPCCGMSPLTEGRIGLEGCRRADHDVDEDTSYAFVRGYTQLAFDLIPGPDGARSPPFHCPRVCACYINRPRDVHRHPGSRRVH